MDVSLILYGVVVIILVKIAEAFIKWRRFVNIVDRIPGPKAYPIIGTMWEFWSVEREGN